MFKKVKHANGKREIFLFGKRILSYTKMRKRLDFYAQNFCHKDELNLLAQKHNALVASLMILQRSDESAILALRQCLMPTPKVQNTQNIVRYLELLRPFVSPSLKLVRVGGVGDGGYAMLDPAAFEAHSFRQNPLSPPPPPHSMQRESELKTPQSDKIQPKTTQNDKSQVNFTAQTSQNKALSLGVSAYSPWDLDMANRGFLVFEFDASIEKSPYPEHPNIKFFKQFVGAKDSVQDGVETIAFERLLRQCEFDTNAHNILQCDIENAEWEILQDIDIALLARHFSQMTFEFHQLYPDDEAGCALRFGILERINEYFAPIWVHYNSCGDGLIIANLKSNSSVNLTLPYVPLIEVTYLRKDLLPKDAKPFGSGLFRLNIDSPNAPTIPDVPVIFP